MKKKSRIFSGFMAMVILLSLCFTFSVSADVSKEAVLDYLSNWSYTDGSTNYAINVDAMTDEDLAPYMVAKPDDWDAMIHEYLGLAFEQLVSENSHSYIVPPENNAAPLAVYPREYTPSEVQYVDFKYGNGIYTREYLWTMTVNLNVTSGSITSIGTTNCTINCGDHLNYADLTKEFATNHTSYASVGYSVELIGVIGYVTASTVVSLEHDFYV